MSNVTFGDKVGAEYLYFMVGKDEKEMHCAWYSKIQVNGKMVLIYDASVEVGPKEMQAQTRYKARKKAKEFLEKMKAKENAQ